MSASAGRPVLLLWGESDFLLREGAQEALGGGKPTEVDAGEWQGGETTDLATPSLFGEARALVIADAQDLSDDALADIRRYGESPVPEARLVLLVRVGPRAKGPPASLTRSLGEAVEVRRVALDRRDLAGWVRDRARTQGVSASPAGAQTLVGTVGEDPAVLHQAVAQIAAAHPGEGITPETVAAQFRGFGDRRIWELCDAAFGHDLPAALRCLAGMLEAREEPLAVLGGIAARLRELVRVRSLPPRMPPSELARAAGLRFEWQARRFRDQARRFSDRELADLHARVVEADRSLKLGGDGEVVLPRLVVRIAGAGRG